MNWASSSRVSGSEPSTTHHHFQRGRVVGSLVAALDDAYADGHRLLQVWSDYSWKRGGQVAEVLQWTEILCLLPHCLKGTSVREHRRRLHPARPYQVFHDAKEVGEQLRECLDHVAISVVLVEEG